MKREPYFDPNFFVLEGPQGSGKGSVRSLLEERFREHQVSAVWGRQPGGGGGDGELYRNFLFDLKARGKLNGPDAEALLAYHSRRWMHTMDINPALDNGVFFGCERDQFSTWVYNFDLNTRDFLDSHEKRHVLYGNPEPGLRVVMMIDPNEAVSRLRLREDHEGDPWDVDESVIAESVNRYWMARQMLENGQGPAIFRRNTVFVDTDMKGVQHVADEVGRLIQERMGVNLDYEEVREGRVHTTPFDEQGVLPAAEGLGGHFRGWTR
jgi:thymidylate kinase